MTDFGRDGARQPQGEGLAALIATIDVYYADKEKFEEEK
jgi:hypothetical protein